MAILGIFSACTALPTQHFVEWFPDYGHILDAAAREDCATTLSNYFNGESPQCFGYAPTCLSNLVVSCILANVSENLKANMAAAAVVLGLLPSALGLAGSSTAELGILAHHRPVLTTLLVLGTPVVSPIRAFEFSNPITLLERGEESLQLPPLRGRGAIAVSFLQYALAAAASNATSAIRCG